MEMTGQRSGEWPVQELARLAGTTSRTLRHYGELGLLPPSRIGRNGYRYYDTGCLIRLQRILLLRELGLGLPSIAEVLDGGGQDTVAALRTHLELLRAERRRIERQIRSVRITISKTEAGEPLMAEEVLDGFDHSQYEREVTERWGADAWERGDRWWRSLTAEQKETYQRQHLDIARDFAAALQAGHPAASEQTQAIACRHFEWLSLTEVPSRDRLLALAQMWVADPRFAANYDRHGVGTAAYVADAMAIFAEDDLPA